MRILTPLGLALAISAASNGVVRPEPVLAREGHVIALRAGDDLQAALNQAQFGDTIVLQAGATFRGPFGLPPKRGDGWIEVRTSALTGGFVPAGTRVDPSMRDRMPKLIADAGSVIVAGAGAQGFRFVGIEIAPAPGVSLHNLIQLGADESNLASVPRRFAFERCYIHGDARVGSRRGIALNSADTSVLDSYISDFKLVGFEAQALMGWNGPGPFRTVNNYLEGAGENLMFGGADPSIPGLVPSDIEIRGNTLSKPLSWRRGSKTYAGTAWTVKNILELKNARRVVIDGNVLEFNWPESQNGFAVLFTPRNQDGKSPWSVVEDVTFSNNLVRHVGSGINVLGTDDIHDSAPTQRIVIRNNLFLDVGGKWGEGKLIQLLHGVTDVTIDHNTAIQTDAFLYAGDTRPHAGVIVQNNIALDNALGIIGSGTVGGMSTIEHYLPKATIRRNAIAGGFAPDYPRDNFFPKSISQIGFQDPAGDFRLAPSSPFKGAATDGGDLGVDIDALRARLPAGATPTAAPPTSVAGVTDFAGLELSSAGLPSHPVALAIFWVSLAGLVYTMVGYGAIIRALARFRNRRVIRAAGRPSVTVVIVAHNEEDTIGPKLENLLGLDYPHDRLDVLIASDGSTDGTVARATAAGPRVDVRAFSTRRGKPAVLNDVVSTARGEIVVLADARQRFDTFAISALVECFADTAVGAVSGELVLLEAGESDAGVAGAAAYWDYEKTIRYAESLFDTTIGATGAIYAIRREVFEPIPADTVLDDVLIPMHVSRKGYRVLFEPAARAYDRRSASARDEFRRKTRTMAGNFQLFTHHSWLLNPFQNRVWWQTISHKTLRLLLPIYIGMTIGANAFLLDLPFYQLTMAGAALAGVAALAGHAMPAARRRVPLVVLPYTLAFLSWAVVVGFIRFVTGRQRVTWERTAPLALGTRVDGY